MLTCEVHVVTHESFCIFVSFRSYVVIAPNHGKFNRKKKEKKTQRITPHRMNLANEKEKQNQFAQSSYTTKIEIIRSIHAFKRILTFWAVNCELTAVY